MEIIQSLLNQCNSIDQEIRAQAEQTINQMRIENKNAFLEMLMNFLISNDHSSVLLDTLALIITYQTIPFSVTNILSEFDPNLINNLLKISTSFFSSNDFALRSSSATLFLRILLNDQNSGSVFRVNEILNELFIHPISPLIIHPLSIIISDYFLFFSKSVNENFILLILDSLPIFFQVQNPEIDYYCLDIISTLIPSMGEIMSKQIERIFSTLLKYCQNPQTKAKSFECLSILADYFYILLGDFLPILTSTEFINLFAFPDDFENGQEIMNKYLLFWKTISKIEKNEYFSNLGIIQNSLFQLLPIILKISSTSQFEIRNSDINEPSIQAHQVLNNILCVFIEEGKPILDSFIQQFQNSESFGEREASLSCVYFIIQYYDTEFNMDDINFFFFLIMKGLNDQVHRVRQNAIYCVEAFCCRFPINCDQSLELMKDVINKIAVDEFSAEDAAYVIGNLFSIENFPFFNESMNALISICHSSNLDFASTGFESLSQFILFAPNENRMKLLDFLLDLLKNCPAFTEFHLDKLIGILTELIFKLGPEIDQKFDHVWEILSNGASKLPFQFVLPISEMSLACPAKFSPFLQSTLNLINGILNTENFQPACKGFINLIESLDLSPFKNEVESILISLIKLLRNQDLSASNKGIVIDIFDTINRKIPSLFESVFLNVFPIILSLSSELDDWEDFDANSSYIRFFSGILENDQIQLYLKIGTCHSIFSIVKLVTKSQRFDTNQVDYIIDALQLCERMFPDLLKEFYNQCTALEMMLENFLSVENVDKTKIEEVLDFLLT